MPRTTRAQLSERSRCTMCVNSCVKTIRIQLSVSPMNSDPGGHVAVTMMVSYGAGVAQPLARSV